MIQILICLQMPYNASIYTICKLATPLYRLIYRPNPFDFVLRFWEVIFWPTLLLLFDTKRKTLNQNLLWTRQMLLLIRPYYFVALLANCSLSNPWIRSTITWKYPPCNWVLPIVVSLGPKQNYCPNLVTTVRPNWIRPTQSTN